MTTLQEVEEAVRRLPPTELEAFRVWFAEYDYARWDEQLDKDVRAGRLDALADEALRHREEGSCTER